MNAAAPEAFAGPDAARKRELAARLEDARAHTLRLLAPLSRADLSKQHSPIMSPLIWDLGHIGNFEELWLVQQLGERPPIDANYDQMYDAFKNPRRERIHLPLLDRDQAGAYLDHVRRLALAELARADLRGPDPLTRGGFVFEMILQHEYQHDETMLATLQLMAAPGYRPELPPLRAPGVELPEMVLVPAGPFLLGTDDRIRAYDNERPQHEVDIAAFWIDTAPVTNAAYQVFMADGGYRRPELWSERGQVWLHDSEAQAPLHWVAESGAWLANTFGHVDPLASNAPVEHVCYYEAEAYAAWAGKRLPTEVEWEKAASWDPVSATKRVYPWGDAPPTPELANLGQTNFRPMPVGTYPDGASAYGCHHMIGDVWEWVATDFHGYPGFEAWPYAEYSEVFFGSDYKMLRGGAWSVRPGVIRTTFRNWDYPIRRQIFSGFRCARDA